MKRPVVIALVLGVVMFALLIALAVGSALFLGTGGGGITTGGNVAVVDIEGVIMDSEDVIKELRGYTDNHSIKAIVLRINSPGGAVVPSQDIFEEVNRIRDEGELVVVTSMGSVAASGGYYIAAASDKIMASPGTLTGSIGVIMQFMTAQALMEKVGVKSEVIKSGEMKDVGNFMREMTEPEREYMQAVIDDVHMQFVEAVAKGRKMKKADVMELANGSVYTGRQARALGLVDELGDLGDAVELAGKLANIEGEPKVISKKHKFTLVDLLSGEDPSNMLRKVFMGGSPSLMYLCAVSG